MWEITQTNNTFFRLSENRFFNLARLFGDRSCAWITIVLSVGPIKESAGFTPWPMVMVKILGADLFFLHLALLFFNFVSIQNKTTQSEDADKPAIRFHKPPAGFFVGNTSRGRRGLCLFALHRFLETALGLLSNGPAGNEEFRQEIYPIRHQSPSCSFCTVFFMWSSSGCF